MPQFRTPQGQIVTIPEDQASGALASGYEPVSVEQAGTVTSAVTPEDRGVLGGINAAATGLLSGATLGLSDYALKSVLNQGEFERLAAEREGHPIASGVGQIAGAVAPALLAPGSSFARALPSGALSSAMAPLAGRGASGLLAAGAVEGAFQNAGAYLADTALGDRDLTAEGLFGALGAGGAFGVAGGVAALGIERGTIAARRMFSRAAGSDKAALEAEHAWQAAHQSTLEAHDAAADIAKAQLAEARAAREQAQLAKQRAGLRVVETEQAAPELDAAYRAAQVERDQVRDAAKAAYEATPAAPAGPNLTPEARAGLHDLGLSDADIAAAAPHELAAALRIVEGANAELATTAGAALSPAKEASLAAAVAEHDAARLELDDLLRNIEAPAIEPGVASGVKVPRGQFEDLTQRGPLAQGTPVQVTTVGKKLGEGTPADATSLLEPGSIPAFDPKSRTYHDPGTPWRKAEEFAPSEPATGIHERPSGLEGLVRAQREAGPTGLEDLVRLQREAAPRSVETVRAEYENVMARLKASKDVPERRALSSQADALSDELDAMGDFTPAVQKAPPKPADSDRFAPGKDGVIPVLEHPTDEAANFLIRRVREVANKSEARFGPKTFLGSLGVDWSIPQHQKTLLALMRDGKVALSRADLVGAMDPAMVKASEITDSAFGGRYRADFHFITDDGRKLADVVTPKGSIGLDAPIDKLSLRQLDEYQRELDRAFSAATPDSPEYKALAKKWDESVAQRRALLGDAKGAESISRPPGTEQHTAAMSDAEFGRLSSEFARSLTASERSAAVEYSSASHDTINRALRGQRTGPLSEESRETLGHLDSLMSKASTPRDMVVMRGIKDDRVAARFKAMKPGDEFVDEGFVSTTVSAKPTREFSNPEVEFRIAVPKGSRGAPIPATKTDERELLLGRGQRFRVESSVYDPVDKKTIIRATLLGDGRAAAPASDLEAALQGTAAKLDTGQQLGALSRESPAAADYVSKKLAKRVEDAAYFRAKHAKPTGLEDLVSAQSIASKDVAADDFFSQLTKPKTRDQYVAQNIGRAMREEGSHAKALAKVEREWAEMGGHPMAVAKLERDLDAAVERAAVAADPVEQAVAQQEVRALEEQLSQVGARPGALEDVAAAAEVITKYERAAAKLTEELGPSAPPAAQEAAKAFRAAEDEAERKTMARTTRAIDDGVDSQGRPRTVEYMARKESEARMAAKSGPPARPSWDELEARYGKYAGQPPLPPTAEEAATAARAEAKAADVAYKRSKVAETEARIGARQAQDMAASARAAAEAARPVAAGAVSPQMSTLGAVATAIGIAGEVGVPGVPHPKDIPIIGPLLSLYLKYKALKYATGRFVGRVSASGDTRVAALAAKTKDKIATAVDKTLGLVEAGARKGRPAIVAAATVLGHRIFDDGEPNAPKNASAQELAAVRIREIANAATRPDLVTAYVRKEMRGVVDPDLLDAAERHLIARFEYLNRVAPKAPPPNPYSQRKWVPSVAETSTLAQRLEVVHDPTSAFDHPTPAKIDTLRSVSPRLLQLAQERLVERIADAKNPVPYEQRLRASHLFSVPLDDSMRPEHAAILATAHAPSPITDAAQTQPTAPAPSIAGNTNLSSVYRTGTERRAL